LRASNVFLDGVFKERGASLTSPTTGRIGGDGEFHGTVTLWNATLSPGAEGNAVGDLLLGSASINGLGHFDVVGTKPGTEHDQLTILRALTLGGPLELAVAYSPDYYDSFMIIDSRFAGPITGTFKDLSEGASFLAAGRLWQVTYLGGDGGGAGTIAFNRCFIHLPVGQMCEMQKFCLSLIDHIYSAFVENMDTCV
jgi:hypothetical protein